MTLIMVDACERAGGLGWSGNYEAALASAGAARTGAKGTRLYVGFGARKEYTIPVAANQHATMTVGFAYKQTVSTSPTPNTLLVVRTGGTDTMSIQAYSPTGNTAINLRLVRTKDNVVLWDSGTPLVDGSTWYYIELKVTVHPTAGSVELRTNEVTRVVLTGIDTTSSNAADTLITGFIWYAVGNADGYSNVLDDFYLNNGAGSVNNSFNGDTTVHALRPNAAGLPTQFTPTGVAANWDNVNETDLNTQDYNEANVVTFTDLYSIDNLPAAAAGKQVFGVQIHGVLASVSLPRSGALVIGSAALNTEPAVIALTTQPTEYRYILETKPGGGTWSTADVDAAQIGVRVKS
ncbi:MAG: hypothetical protein WKF86_00180 [Acidimicrobiales bacterium]